MKTWVEVAVNGPWRRDLQPRVPLTPAEIVDDCLRCIEAGASLLHVHAFRPDGRDDTTGEIYAEIIERVRALHDVPVYPSIAVLAVPGVARFAHLEFLAARGLLELTVVDPGSVNISPEDESGAPMPSLVYSSSPVEIAEGLEFCTTHAVHPGYAIYEPGFTRAGAALARHRPAMPEPVYRFMFSERLAFGYRPSAEAIDAHLLALRQEAPGSVWMVAGLDFDVLPHVAEVVARGGGVRTGLEDAPFGTTRTNEELTIALVEAVRETGAEIATAEDVRAELSRRRAGVSA
jgi:uncharacterized protein (DUF849 family)